MTHNNTLNVIVTRVDVDKYPNFPDTLRLYATYNNIFNNKQTEISVRLTETINSHSKVFKADKLKQALDILNQYTDESMELPKKIDYEAVEKTFKPLIDKEITVFVEEIIKEDKHTGEKQTRVAYTLEPMVIKDYVNNNSSIKDLLKRHPEFEHESFLVKPVAFILERNDGYFTKSGYQKVNVIEETKTREGLARHIYKILLKDKTKKGKEIRDNLANYINSNKNDDGKYEGTTSDILKEVGAFTHNSVNAKGLSKHTVTMLNNLVDDNSATDKANIASLRLVFSIENEDNYTYKTRKLKEQLYKSNTQEILVATINPDDTNYMEFDKFTQPLNQIGALDLETDFKELKGMTKWFNITEKLIEIMNRENVYARIEVSQLYNNYTCNLTRLEKKV